MVRDTMPYTPTFLFCKVDDGKVPELPEPYEGAALCSCGHTDDDHEHPGAHRPYNANYALGVGCCYACPCCDFDMIATVSWDPESYTWAPV